MRLGLGLGLGARERAQRVHVAPHDHGRVEPDDAPRKRRAERVERMERRAWSDARRSREGLGGHEAGGAVPCQHWLRKRCVARAHGNQHLVTVRPRLGLALRVAVGVGVGVGVGLGLEP